MLFKYILASFLPLAAIASPAAVPDAAAAAELLQARTVNGHCSGTATGIYRTDGICVSTSTCNSYSGSYISGGCPSDANNIKCCVIGLDPVSVNPCGGSSYCTWTSERCGGTRVPGR